MRRRIAGKMGGKQDWFLRLPVSAAICAPQQIVIIITNCFLVEGVSYQNEIAEKVRIGVVEPRPGFPRFARASAGARPG
jgi:hypothetical protein